MDVLFRHTFIGDCIGSLHARHDISLLKRLTTTNERSVDESSRLLPTQDDSHDSEILLVDWYNHDDTDNPSNWPLTTKWIVVAVLCITTVAMYTGSAFWSVCIKEVVEEFGVPEVVAQLGTSLFVVGFGFGPMVWSPISELPAVGRWRVYAYTSVAFILCQIPIPLVRTIGGALALRFLTGFFCSPVLAVGGGTVADMFNPVEIGYPMACWELATWGGSALGPTFAGFTYENFGYKGPMWELVFLGIFGLLCIFCLLPETLPGAILHQRAQRFRKEYSDQSFITQSEMDDAKVSLSSKIRGIFIKALALNFQEPIVFVLNLYVALVFAIFFGMLESYPFVFQGDPYNFNSGETGLTFLGIFAGGALSMFLYFAFLTFHQDDRFDAYGNITPEERLWPAVPGGIFVPIGLLVYGWTANLHWFWPVFGGALFGIGMFTIFMAMLQYLPDAYPEVAATTIAGNCLMRALLAATFPLFTVQFYEYFGAGVASSILAGLGLLFVPWPVILLYRGRQIRMRSKNARHDI